MDHPSGFYKNKFVTILGGRGYIGSQLAVALSQCGAYVGLDRVRMEEEAYWVFVLDRNDVVFHLAAETNAQTIGYSPATHLQNELVPTLKMLEVAKNMDNPPRIIFAGTVTQFGFTDSLDIVTDGRVSVPQTFYDVGKQMIEQSLRAYSIEHGLLTTTLRLANVYGPSLVKEGENRGWVNRLVQDVLKGKTPAINASLLSKLRDFVYIDDVVEAFLRVGAGKPKYLDGASYIVASGLSYSFADLIACLERILHIPIAIEKLNGIIAEPIDYRSFVCNPALMRDDFDWEAKTSLEEGLKELVNCYG